MRRNILLSLLAAVLLAGCYSVTPVTEHTGRSHQGLFYSLPVTTICVDVTYRYRDLAGAIFSRYASEMLALDDFDPEKPYQIQHIDVTYEVGPDPSAYCCIQPRGLALQVDSRHLLRSVGLTADELSSLCGQVASATQASVGDAKLILHHGAAASSLPRYNLFDRTDTVYARGDKPGQPSMVTTRKATRSLRQRAQAAAEEYAELEDTRADILASERYTVEAKETLLQQVEEKQSAILAQFIGKPIVEKVHFFYTPEALGVRAELPEHTLFYFSPIEGICDADAMGAMPVVCRLQPDATLQAVRTFAYGTVDSTAAAKPSRHIQYRVPSQSLLTLSCDLFDYQVTIPVAQFGPLMNLPLTSFKALFDVQTGALIYYKK